ncbi:unnamed protein product [Durusdinium trenchii]|uniref:JmjC domain-containing protein n=1 Tax=Durusdinium trenchii TaxID=1381693 RepID=A0ABP0K2R5_9DINO
MKEPECRLTQGLSSMLNWLVTLKQLKAFPEGNQVAAYIPYLEDLSHIRYVEAWRSTPWFVLLEKPHWSDKFQRSVQRMGSDASDGGACSRLGKLQEQALGLRNDEDIALAIARLQQAAFEAPCFEHFARSMVIFGAAIRPLLPAGAWPWPSSSMPAESGKTQSIWRLCNQPDITHRRVGQAELHFFSADVILVGEELQVELLWTATSDDSCIMVGSNSERENDTYYSFLHTLPHSHLMHWECAFNMPQGIEFHSSSAAASTSLSGFTSISTCRVPPDTAAAKLLKWETRATAALELQLRAAWRPEPLRLCPRSRAVVRRVSACSSPLHHADRIHKLLPHAVEDWLNYHFAIGIEHFTVFDTDGSYKRFVQPFVEQGLVTYHERFPYQVSPKLGLAAEAKELRKQRHMLLEPHALELCIWENRQVSDWVVVIHSFEEYLHSRILAEKLQDLPLGTWIQQWANEVPGTVVFELFQEPMGGPRRAGRSIFTTWTQKRGVEMSRDPGLRGLEADSQHFQSFAWIVDPVNVLQTAVHLAQPRAHGQSIVSLHVDLLRVNHYLDLGRNASRCLEELGGCHVLDESLTWAEETVLERRLWIRLLQADFDRSLVSHIPYGSDFGLDASLEQPVTLEEFLRSCKRRRIDEGAQCSSGKGAVRGSIASYFFVAVDDEAQPEIARVFAEVLGLVVGGPLTFPCFHSSCPFRTTTLQFAVGDAGSGSPMHFHQDAVNLLLLGKKRWWLRPPSMSAMSRLHPLDAVNCSVEEVEQCYSGACVLEQEAGDVVYIPDMWGHAVLNLENHTVCAATEFA